MHSIEKEKLEYLKPRIIYACEKWVLKKTEMQLLDI